ncbi:MAG: hypothetical protein WCY88_15290 [Spongiibacteraceae bacterium]
MNKFDCNNKPAIAVTAKGALLLGTLLSSALANSAVLEEVIVTAQKRAESLQDVPISVAAVSGEKMQDNFIRVA